MTTTRDLNMYANPILMWSKLMREAVEMAFASAQVIGWRTSRLGQGSPASAVRQLNWMGQEKKEAVIDSAQAAGTRMLRLNQEFAALAVKQMLAVSTALMAIAASRSPAESVARQTKLARDTVASTVVAGSRLSKATAQVARRALKPVRKRVSANAKRIGKR